MINGGPLHRARHRPLVSWEPHCAECGKSCLEEECGHSPSFVSSVPVAAVLEQARELLDQCSSTNGTGLGEPLAGPRTSMK